MKLTIIFCLFGAAIADLRQASQAKKGYKLLQQGGGRGSKNFAVGTGSNPDGTTNTQAKGTVLYMEPSTFNYQGLKNQRKKNYDNFLRSNIDNEQDNRNFNNEDGKDHLPFRTCDGSVPTQFPYTASKPGCDGSSNGAAVKTVLNALPGEPKLTPLRWNNPHASEIELNLWLMASNPPTIVPIKKPTCSGEGNQNNILQWAIPSDFYDVNWNSCDSTRGKFTGCNKEGDCVLQIYAHSIEPRQYSTSVPIIIPQQTYQGKKLDYKPQPGDADEATSFAWPSSVDLKSMVEGDAPSNPPPPRDATRTPSLSDLQICASSEREGISANGDSVDYVKLQSEGQEVVTLNAPIVNLYLCKTDDAEKNGEQLVDKVVFTITSSPTGQANTFTQQAGTKTENWTPFEYSSTTLFGGAGIKKIQAVVTAYNGQSITITKFLDLRQAGGKRWRFRRHLRSVCPTGSANLKEPFPDPWLDMSKLQRETCLSAQDPNANYATTQVQRAVLHSDVANHAYQNSNYSPYSGQQHQLISRQMQASCVLQMTSGNRGELGKNNIPNNVKKALKTLNNQVNTVYKAYEKVANKVIDELTNKDQAKGKNGGNMNMGVQALGNSFRSAEKGATSTKRLKTTTYVPSFDATGYNQAIIQNAIKSRTGGNKAKYADLLSDPKPNTGRQYIEIYTAALNQLLPAFKAAEALGITYMESLKKKPCVIETDQTLKTLSDPKNNNRQATACCIGSMQNTEAGGCGATLQQRTNFKKKNQNGNNDGGYFSAREFNLNRYMTQYGCPRQCMYPITQQKNAADPVLGPPVTKGSTGTCLHYKSGAACVKTLAATDCRVCAGIFNNVAVQSFASNFQISSPSQANALERMIKRVETAPQPESFSNILSAAGDPLTDDNTAMCFTPSSFTCPNAKEDGSDFEAQVNAGDCKEVQSAKIDDMCDDGPCDSDDTSRACALAKAKCLVDPDTGTMCMPGNENDPCKGCVRTVGVDDSGNVVALSFATVVVLASMML